MSGCEKYAELMNRYLDGDLPASQISDLLDHLETCASCRNRFDALKIMAFEMRHMQTDPPPLSMARSCRPFSGRTSAAPGLI